jgi:hypothetical protein
LRVGQASRRAAIAAWAAFAPCLFGCSERGFDGERAFAHLVAQVEMGPRIPGSEGHRAALAYFVEHLERTADTTWVHRFEEISPLDSSRIVLESVIASFNPRSRDRILFGAHWDTRPVADREPDESRRTEPVPGANDGASGVAVLLELATSLARKPPAVGVEIALFDGEDSGVEGRPDTYALGSQRFVKEFVKEKGTGGYRPAFAVIVDMVGRRGTRIPREGVSVRAAGALVDRIWALGREIGLTVLADSIGPEVMDDHVAFLREGIPAVDLIDLSDPAWHTTRDLPENCAPESLAEIGRLLLEIVRAVEDRESS